MLILREARRPIPIEPVDRRRRLAWPATKPGDCSRLVDEACLVYEGDELKIAHVYLHEDTAPLLRAIQSVEFGKGYRTSGLKSESRIFGYSPRNELRRDYCSTCAMAKDNPGANAELLRWAPIVTGYLSEFNKPKYFEQAGMLEQVRPEWKIPGSLFTSGILNKNSALHYHFDSGNFKGAWSAMIVLIEGMAGGHLNIPEFDLSLRFRTGSLLLFDGQGLLHGVTQLQRQTPRAFRYSVVYYALSRMRNCLCPQEELARIRQVKTRREQKRGGK